MVNPELRLNDQPFQVELWTNAVHKAAAWCCYSSARWFDHSLRSDAMGRLSAKIESKKEFMFKDRIRNSDVLMFFAFYVKVIWIGQTWFVNFCIGLNGWMICESADTVAKALQTSNFLEVPLADVDVVNVCEKTGNWKWCASVDCRCSYQRQWLINGDATHSHASILRKESSRKAP